MAAISATSGSAGTDPTGNNSPQTPPAATDPLANQSTFLTLLVSQLKNQNPSSPLDGTTFVTQLAQFSDLQQTLAVRQDMDTLSSKFTGTSSLTIPTTASDSSSGSN